jgi:7-carboxy-7-deazaguanine synthase
LESRSLRVSEIFTSVQGEGPFCCRVALFIRLAGCNLRCPFCDTKYSWDPGKGRLVSLEDLIAEASKHSFIVVTGGEPLLQRRQLNDFLEVLWRENPHVLVQVETNGTLPAPEPHEALYEAYYVVSPKDVPVSVERAKTHSTWFKYARISGRAWFKVLVHSEEDVLRVSEWARENSVPHDKVYLMPLTSKDMSREALLEIHRRVALLSMKYGFHFSPRMHLLLGLK